MTDRASADSDYQLLVVDAGNTNTAFGVFRNGGLVAHLRLSTDRRRTADELAATILPLLAAHELDPKATDGVLVSSVVPPLDVALEQLAFQYFGCPARFVTNDLPVGIDIRYPNPTEIGADRIVNAVAAVAAYGAPVVVVDFGTATTFDVVDAGGAYVGGVIAPGLMISAEALFAHASRLYRINVRRPESLIGTSTDGAMQSGIYYGYIGQVDGILARLSEALPDLKTVVATGGLARLVAEGSAYIRDVAPRLTIHGLRLIDERLRAAD